ncbi:MAG: TetR family transcriptional regulator [Myxococcota bacterium]
MSRTRPDGDRTRERILDVALPLFAESGFAGTSVRTIATAAGVNVATLAYHFQDKEGLYDTVVQRLHADLAGFPTSPTAAPPADALRWYIGEAWAFARAHRQHLRLLLRHVLDHGAQPQVVLDRWSEPLLVRADALLAPFRPDWPPARRRMLVLSLMHLTVRLVLEDPRQLSLMSGIPEDAIEREVVDWLAGLAGRELGLDR